MPLPPSANKIYKKNKWGGLCLSKEAKNYESSVQRITADPENFSRVCRLETGKEVAYSVFTSLFFPALENAGWYTVGADGEREAKSRYKRIDYDNRIKFMQDCLARAIGIDDCQIFKAGQEKRQDAENPRADVYISVVDVNEFLRSEP